MTSQEFKAIRDQLGLTQTELGEIMGMKQQAIQRIETKRAPTAQHEAFILFIQKYLPRKVEECGHENKSKS